MWRSVLFDDRLVRALLKSAIETGHISLIEPETKSEQEQVKRVKSRINRSRSQRAALMYCLLADTVFLDGGGFGGWEVFRNLTEESNDYSSRYLLEHISSEISAFTKATDSSRNFSVEDYLADCHQQANLFASLEPLIWHSFKRQKHPLTRKTLRDSLDLIVLEPELIDLYKEGSVIDFDTAVVDAIREHWPYKRFSKEMLAYLNSVIYVTIVKGQVAANKMKEAIKREAVYPLDGLTFGQNRYTQHQESFPAAKSQDIIAATKIFLEEIEYWPLVNDIEDVFKMREHKHFLEFRDILRRWVQSLIDGDKKIETELRLEIKKANNALQTATQCAKIGGFFTYVALPLLILDVLLAPVFGPPATVVGFGLQAYSDWKKREGRWLIMGT